MNGLFSLNPQARLPFARPARSCWVPVTVLCLLALMLCLCTPLSVQADSAFPASVQSSIAIDSAPRSPLVAGFWDWLHYLSPPGIGNRRTMLQIGVVGMCIALYIIIWRK